MDGTTNLEKTKKKGESKTNRKRKKARQTGRACMRRRGSDGWTTDDK